MTVSKLTNNVKPLDEVDKINEIIDELDNIDPLPSQTGQSGKYLTTNGTVPSWAEVQSLPSQTGKAGKFLQTDGTDASWESAPFRNIGEIVSSAIPLTDAGLHLLDGSLIQGDGIYSAFVTYIAGLVSTYPNLFVSESDWQTAVTTYGVCGKFVYDSVNNTVRLPKITGIIEGTTDLSTLGDLVEAGLPNITGTFASITGGIDPTGVFRVDSSTNGSFPIDSSYRKIIGFNASRSSAIYGNSNTVQPQTIKAFYYIVIATSTKTDIEVDIDEIATDLNSKVSTGDLAEVQCIVEVSDPSLMPSYYYVRSDGWCVQGGISNSGSAVTITLLKPYTNTNYNLLNSINNDYQSNSNSCTWGSASAYKLSNSQIRLGYSGGGNLRTWQASGYII